MEEKQKLTIDGIEEAEIKSVIYSSNEGTYYYRKFVVIDDIIVGEIVSSPYDCLRYNEIVRDKAH